MTGLIEAEPPEIGMRSLPDPVALTVIGASIVTSVVILAFPDD